MKLSTLTTLAAISIVVMGMEEKTYAQQTGAQALKSIRIAGHDHESKKSLKKKINDMVKAYSEEIKVAVIVDELDQLVDLLYPSRGFDYRPYKPSVSDAHIIENFIYDQPEAEDVQWSCNWDGTKKEWEVKLTGKKGEEIQELTNGQQEQPMITSLDKKKGKQPSIQKLLKSECPEYNRIREIDKLAQAISDNKWGAEKALLAAHDTIKWGTPHEDGKLLTRINLVYSYYDCWSEIDEEWLEALWNEKEKKWVKGQNPDPPLLPQDLIL